MLPGGAGRQVTPTFLQPGGLSPQRDVGPDGGLLIMQHPAGKVPPGQLGLCLPRVLQRVCPIWVSCDLGGHMGLDLVPVFHPDEVQVGGVEVARVASEIHSLRHREVPRRGVGGDRHSGDN